MENPSRGGRGGGVIQDENFVSSVQKPVDDREKISLTLYTIGK